MNTAENITETTEPTKTAIVAKDDLVRAIKAALPWASPDATRAHISSVCIDLEHGRVVATDGHTLIALDVAGLKTGEPVQVLLSAGHCKTVAAWKTVPYEDCAVRRGTEKTVTIDPNGTSIDFGDVTFLTVQNEKFPPYTKVVPTYEAGKGKGTDVIGLDARFLARLEKVEKLYMGKKGSPLVKVLLGGTLDPVKCEFTHAPGLAVIMPARV